MMSCTSAHAELAYAAACMLIHLPPFISRFQNAANGLHGSVATKKMAMELMTMKASTV
jgi:hypothetical protein